MEEVTVDWEQYGGVDWAEDDRRRQQGITPQGRFRTPKRYRKYNKERRAAQAERLQRHKEHNAKRRREHGSGAQETK
jgi:hypothetical protein